MFHDIPSLFLSYALFFSSSFVSAFHSVLYSFGDTFCNRGGRCETPKTVYFKNTANKMELHCVESRRSVVLPSLFLCVCLYVEERDYCFACDQAAEKVDCWIKEYMYATDIKAYFCESR